ncbi:MAG: hypothetical protein JXB62_08445 [Pirellulales bacterium]|nr:hypothetical protein [Pirellulales bacterium]
MQRQATRSRRSNFEPLEDRRLLSIGQGPDGDLPPDESLLAGSELAAAKADFLFEFSVDIGSDAELSDPNADGNEGFDPGDVYQWQSSPVDPGGRDGFRDDETIFGVDPNPDPPDLANPPATAVPVGAGGVSDYREFFDLDGHDQVDGPLIEQIPPDAALQAPIPHFSSNCVMALGHLAISFDDDEAEGWPTSNVPVAKPSPTGQLYGTTADADEIVGVTLGPGGSPGVLTVASTYAVADEVTIHQSLAPNPDAGEAEDDDVDALDVVAVDGANSAWLFSADHEGTFGLDPGDIYTLGAAAAAPVKVIDHAIHLGLRHGVDIDAFELVWLQQEPGTVSEAALLFSVDEDDPLTTADESGGRDPRMLYVSFLTGSSSALLEEPLKDDIDALANWSGALVPERLDWGDAPDTAMVPGYPTLAIHDGARHVIRGPWLGDGTDPPDADADGQPSGAAMGDDLADGNDDEDGVTIPDLVRGQANNIVVQVHAGGMVAAWIDYNGNHIWDVPGEQIYNGYLPAGMHTIPVTPPANATLGETYARFRIANRDEALLPFGRAESGEVEDYQVTIHERRDWGDAPDPTYPTLAINNGASHTIDPEFFLGHAIDSEIDGQPDHNAMGDDTHGVDDEDGVLIPTLRTGQVATIEVTASADGLLDAWIDFNGNGSWGDFNEQVFASVPLVAGVNWLNVLVPASASIEEATFARFRFSREGGLSYDGSAGPGEVEDYPVRITTPRDWGDAPDSYSDPGYPTLEVHSGANHVVIPGIFLGDSIDAEQDGQPDPHAMGDDNSNVDDEDGVVFNTHLVAGHMALVTVTASVPGYLNAWMDFNSDGDWTDPGEKIYSSYSLAPGANLLNVAVPADAATGAPTFARFRFSVSTGLLPAGGEAPDGEVEDYEIVVRPPLDFGDAPDSPLAVGYPTLAISGGAHHVLEEGFYLGNGVDAELDGQPDPTALGDDMAGDDDEDGVAFTSRLVPGSLARVDVIASAPGRLDAWIDFNGDVSWAQPGDQIFFSQPLVAGMNSLVFPVPDSATMDLETFARFRFSHDGGLSYGGFGAEGEVEDFRVRIAPMDFGDAPEHSTAAGYPTLLASDGARHAIRPGFYLGGGIDGEADGQPHPCALGDDFGLLDDEDGVQFDTLLSPNATAQVTVTASADGLLQGWIDFNNSGTWAEAGEQIFLNEPLVAGANVLQFNVPSWVVAGKTFARFRFSSLAGLPYDGPAIDGEVEDYQVRILSTKWEQPPDPAEPDNVLLGWNEPSVYFGEQIAADDWLCETDAPVTDLVWWGSFLDWTGADAEPVLPDSFHVAIWSDVPAGADQPWSHPDMVVYEADISRFDWEWVGWDFDPRPLDIPMDPTSGVGQYEAAFKFKAALPEAFYQEAGNNVYWVSIAADYWTGAQPEHVFGWKTRPRDPESAAPDAAVRIWDPTTAWWGDTFHAGEPIYWPTEEQPWDLAFELYSTATAEPKWQQPPEPYLPRDAYNGWDEPSVYRSDQIVADDWLCDTDQPVTDVHWWGSFINWDEAHLPGGEMPEAFHIGFWTDVPADAADPDSYSHPGRLVWEAEAVDYGAEFVGWDFDPRDETAPPEATFYFEYNLPQSDWFWQEAGDNIYWISISAVYGDDAQVIHPWGWKTRPRDPQSPAPDDAVRIFKPTAPTLGTTLGDPGMFPVVNSQYVSSTHVTFGDLHAGIHSVTLSVPDQENPMPLPPAGETVEVNSFFDVFFVYQGPGDVEPLEISLPGVPVRMMITNVTDQTTDGEQVFETEIVSMVLAGNPLPGGVMLREAPRAESEGGHTVRTNLGGEQFSVDSFFDVFCELSIDGGQTWHVADVPLHVDFTYPVDVYRAGEPIYWPTREESWDMAFVLTTQEVGRVDWGDAPDGDLVSGYPTLAVHNGASHAIRGPWFGDDEDAPDAESDGQPHVHALGDDLSMSDDEDGVVIPTLVRGQTGAITVEVNGGGGVVQAWIDFDGNRVWQASEQIYDGFLAEGTHTIPVSVPSRAATGQTFARFRISTRGGLQPHGPADNGEVEDHEVFIAGNDLGDAPDSSNSVGVPMTAYPDGTVAHFPTVYNTGSPPHGPLHLLPETLAFLGRDVTMENEADVGPDEDPTNNLDPRADLADLDGADDAIQSPLALTHCAPNTIDYVVTLKNTMPPQPPLFVNVWFDFNLDGDWDDVLQCDDGMVVPEWAVQNQQLFLPGPGTHTVTTPQFLAWLDETGTEPLETWMRITLAEQPWGPTAGVVGSGGAGPDGGYLFGETEDHYVRIETPRWDFGDAPDGDLVASYPTWLLHDGARHIVGGPWLGGADDTPDAEPDGYSDPDALGDDHHGYDDEEGVAIPPLAAGQSTPITVAVHAGGAGAYLDAWIDFDGNGTWDSTEQIHAGWLPDGVQTIPVSVPNSAAAGETFARFRISSQGGLTPVGPADDGEVEDHKLTIWSPAENTKWVQLPDTTVNGIDIRVDDLHHLADDFECTFPSLLTDVHFWGSWKDDVVGEITNIHLAVYTDDPVGSGGVDPENRYSKPDELLWAGEFTRDDFTESLYYEVPAPGEWWWDPASGDLVAGGDKQIWQYDVQIDPDEAFLQRGTPERPIIYWLEIQVDTAEGTFGWKTRQWPDHFMDDAVFDVGSELPRLWKELRYPEGHPYHGLERDSIDMAFMLTFEDVRMDWGDAPDGDFLPSYPTLAIHGGASHVIAGPWLGDDDDRPDPDPDGQPHADALGDDLDVSSPLPPNDDEDGVEIPTLVQGWLGEIQVHVNGGGGFVDAWLDIDGDGFWQASDQIYAGYLPDGIHTIPVLVPNTSVVGQTFARFRISTEGGLQPGGPAADGEVEDHEVRIVRAPRADLGDAPDSTNNFLTPMTAYPPGGPAGTVARYPTVYQSPVGPTPQGPIHWNPRELAYLGNGVTLENEADVGPDEDMVNNLIPPDDTPDLDRADDGVSLPLVLANCDWNTFDFTVTVINPLYRSVYVNVWFDWNLDGDWDDRMECQHGLPVDEWAVQNQQINLSGPGTFTFATTPFVAWLDATSAEPLSTWMRITLAEQPHDPASGVAGSGGAGPAGGYQYGETEDYFAPIVSAETDWGDAPDHGLAARYPTLRVHDGARHVIDPELRLGQSIDHEPDGQPDPFATGDDNDGNDDEDGIVAATPLVTGEAAQVTVVATGSGLLQGWIDFNQDGDWSDPGEQVALNVPLVAGPNVVSFHVPDDARIGTTFARLRFSTVRDLPVDGPAPDGEVEDYQVLINTKVVDRHIFYNHSSWDGNNPAANANDDKAIAIDKKALLPCGTATFANYTSYSAGINGIMVDIADLPVAPAMITAADFVFKVGNSNNPSTWVPGPPPSSVTVRPGAGVGGSDRVTIVWPNYDIAKQWLQVTVLATANTGLAEDDVFYFGNAVGEAGNSTTNAQVNAVDMLLARNNPRTFLNPAPIDFPYDYNRDQRVNATDMLLARNNQTHFLNALKLITVPCKAAKALPVPAAPVATSAALDAALEDLGALSPAGTRDPDVAPDWLFEFEAGAWKSHRSSAKEPAETQAIDQLLAGFEP